MLQPRPPHCAPRASIPSLANHPFDLDARCHQGYVVCAANGLEAVTERRGERGMVGGNSSLSPFHLLPPPLVRGRVQLHCSIYISVTPHLKRSQSRVQVVVNVIVVATGRGGCGYGIVISLI